jgi:sugar O-acyltransferase (sialic acid O-acetyltransferase NeuD family)
VSESKQNIIIVGYSGHSYVVIDSLIKTEYNILGYTEKTQVQFNPFNLNYLGDESSDGFNILGENFIVAIGDNNLRSKIANNIRKAKGNLVNVIDLSSNISAFSSIGSGCYISKSVVLNSLSNLGNDIILNTSSIVEHGCQIHDGVHIGPGTVLCGDVTVGKKTFIGANSVVKQGVSIGDDVIIGAGSVVLRDIPNNEIWYGNPAKKKK